MTSTPPTDLVPDGLLEQLSEDLRVLARIHRSEPDDALISYLQEIDFCGGLMLKTASGEESSGADLLNLALQQLTPPLQKSQVDELNADYAAIYLTNSYRASPYESVWLSEEQLTQQESMFEVRSWHARYALENPDWRSMPDDHICLELEFLATVLASARATAIQDAAEFMDQHLLLWLRDFCQRINHRCSTAFFAGASLLTAQYCDVLRDVLAEVLEIPRPGPEEMLVHRRRTTPVHPDEIPIAFVPGQEPSW